MDRQANWWWPQSWKLFGANDSWAFDSLPIRILNQLNNGKWTNEELDLIANQRVVVNSGDGIQVLRLPPFLFKGKAKGWMRNKNKNY